MIADEIHAPLVLPAATHVPWLELSDAARSCGFALTSASVDGVEGVQPGGTEGSAAGHRFGAHPSGSGPAAGTKAEHAGLLGVLASEVAFSEADDWLDAVLVRLDENRTLLGRLLAEQLPEVRWTPPQASL